MSGRSWQEAQVLQMQTEPSRLLVYPPDWVTGQWGVALAISQPLIQKGPMCFPSWPPSPDTTHPNVRLGQSWDICMFPPPTLPWPILIFTYFFF